MTLYHHTSPLPAGGEAGAEAAAGDGAGDASQGGGGYPPGVDDYPAGADAGGQQQSGGGAEPFERDLGGDGWDRPDNGGGSGEAWGSFGGDDGGDALDGGGLCLAALFVPLYCLLCISASPCVGVVCHPQHALRSNIHEPCYTHDIVKGMYI